VHLAAVKVRVAATGLKAQPAERHVAAAAPLRPVTIINLVAEDPARWAAEDQGLAELWLYRLGSTLHLSLARCLRRLRRLEVEPQRISEEEGLDRAAIKGEGLLVVAEAVEGAIRTAQLCRASEAADVPSKACRAD
jgi:hypothetical protein